MSVPVLFTATAIIFTDLEYIQPRNIGLMFLHNQLGAIIILPLIFVHQHVREYMGGSVDRCGSDHE